MDQYIHSFIYGLIAGLAEILPISSYAHQQIYRYLFEGSSKNVYEKHLKSRIAPKRKIDLAGMYLFCCWKTRI